MEKDLIDQFVRRVAYGKEVRTIDDCGAHAGFPFYFYCEKCGVPTETFPEKPIFAPSLICTQCKILSEQGFLNEAIKVSHKFFGEI